MGAGNVKAVSVTWRHLPDPAFRILVYMALVAQDADRPPLYWGGRESLATHMGRDEPHSAADFRAVARAVQQLVEAGAIVLNRGPSPVSNARYEVVLLRTGDAARHPIGRRGATPEQVTSDDSDRRHPTTDQVTLGDHTGDAARHPEEEQEPPRLTRGLGGHPSASSSDRASDDSERNAS